MWWLYVLSISIKIKIIYLVFLFYVCYRNHSVGKKSFLTQTKTEPGIQERPSIIIMDNNNRYIIKQKVKYIKIVK